MTDLAEPALGGAWQDADWAKRRLRRRYRAERRFKIYGIIAVAVALAFLALLIGSVIAEGYPAFVRTSVALEVSFDPKVLGVGEAPSADELRKADYGRLLRESVFATFPEVTARKERRKLLKLVSTSARFELRGLVVDDPSIIGTTRRVWLTASSDVDMLIKGERAPRRAGRRAPARRPADCLDRHLRCRRLCRDRVQRRIFLQRRFAGT